MTRPRQRGAGFHTPGLLRAALRGATILAAAFGLGCPGTLTKEDKATVADFAAARLYHEDRYERLCSDVVGPKSCADMQGLLQLWKRLNDVANQVQVLGDLPPEEKAELRTVWKKVKALP